MRREQSFTSIFARRLSLKKEKRKKQEGEKVNIYYIRLFF